MTCDMIINQSQLHFVVSSSCACWSRLAVIPWLCHCWQTPLGCAPNDLVVLLSQCVLNLGCESWLSHPSLCQHPLQWWKLRFPVSSSFWVLSFWRHTKKWGKKEREQGQRVKDILQGYMNAEDAGGRRLALSQVPPYLWIVLQFEHDAVSFY